MTGFYGNMLALKTKTKEKKEFENCKKYLCNNSANKFSKNETTKSEQKKKIG